MSQFHSVENDGGLMKEGDYEVVLVKCEEGLTKTTQTPVIGFDFVVRSDVEQAYKKKHIFKSFYMDEETNAYPADKIGKLANALGVPKGEGFDLADLVGQCCILHMKPFKGNDGVERDAIFYSKQTKAGQMVQTPDPSTASGYTEVEDEDLPF